MLTFTYRRLMVFTFVGYSLLRHGHIVWNSLFMTSEHVAVISSGGVICTRVVLFAFRSFGAARNSDLEILPFLSPLLSFSCPSGGKIFVLFLQNVFRQRSNNIASDCLQVSGVVILYAFFFVQHSTS